MLNAAGWAKLKRDRIKAMEKIVKIKFEYYRESYKIIKLSNAAFVEALSAGGEVQKFRVGSFLTEEQLDQINARENIQTEVVPRS